MKLGNNLDRENITDGDREARAYENRRWSRKPRLACDGVCLILLVAAANSLALSHDLHVAVLGAASLSFSLMQSSLRNQLRVRVQAAESFSPHLPRAPWGCWEGKIMT